MGASIKNCATVLRSAALCLAKRWKHGSTIWKLSQNIRGKKRDAAQDAAPDAYF